MNGSTCYESPEAATALSWPQGLGQTGVPAAPGIMDEPPLGGLAESARFRWEGSDCEADASASTGASAASHNGGMTSE